MKTNLKITLMAIVIAFCHVKLNAQNWLTTGNKGLLTTNFLGTTDSKDLVFKAKNIERGRLQNKTGNWRFGSAANNMNIDSAGNLLFSGNATYRIGNNKYAILCNDMPQEGLFMNDDSMRWEFRDDKAFPFFTINNSTYDLATKGGLHIGNNNNNAAIDSAGNLRFSGSATYRIGENKYAIQCDDMPQEGLFMNDDSMRWEFRDDKAFPFFTINNSTYDLSTNGGLQIGNSASSVAGNIRFNAGVFQGFDGKIWKDFKLVTPTQLLTDTIKQEAGFAQQAQINDLQQQIDALKATIQSITSINNRIVQPGLQQNAPNPFNQSTVIHYTLPAKYTTAKIIITNSNGIVVMQHNVSGQEKGLFTLNAGTFVTGAYYYSLVIDGNIVNTKTMMLGR